LSFPKVIDYFGIKVTVDSWAELREAIQELGLGGGVVSEEGGMPTGPSIGHRSEQPPGSSGLSHADRTLLTQFIEAGDRGMLTQQLSHAMGKKGKGVRPALERWSRQINLVTQEGASAFETVKRFDGRGFRMVDHYRRTASSMIGRPI
jgi:hypothetical protein